MQSVRGFLSWAHEEGLFPVTPARVGRLLTRPRADQQRQFPVLTDVQAGALLSAATTPRDRGPRAPPPDFPQCSALLAVMLGGGLRVAEVAALNIGSLRKMPNGRLRLEVEGRGRKHRSVALPPSASEAVFAYVGSTGRTLSAPAGGALFINRDRATKGTGRLTTRSIGRIVSDTAKAAGIEGEAVSPHALRHTAAVHWLRSGLELHEVARLLGHSSISVTQRYIDHIKAEELDARMPEMIGA